MQIFLMFFFLRDFPRTITQRRLKEDGARCRERRPAVRFLQVPLRRIGRGFLYFKETCCIFSSFFFENFPSSLNTINFFLSISRFHLSSVRFKGSVFISLAVGRLLLKINSLVFFYDKVEFGKGTWRVFRLGVNPTPPT